MSHSDAPSDTRSPADQPEASAPTEGCEEDTVPLRDTSGSIEDLSKLVATVSAQQTVVSQQNGQLYEVVKQLWDALQSQLVQTRDQSEALRAEVRSELSRFQLAGPQRAMSAVFLKLFGDLIGYVNELDSLMDIAGSDESDLSSEWLASFAATRNRIETILAEWGCEPIQVEIGVDQFDPELHESVELLPSEGVPKADCDNAIVLVRRRGWRLHDRVLQYPQVVVG